MNEQTFHVGDYVETNTGDRGTILSIDLHLTTGLYTAYLDHDGGTKGSWLVRDLTKVSERADAIKAGYMSGPPSSPIEAWREAVADGTTTLGLDEWMTEQMPAELGPAGEADYEVSISNTFSAEDEQHAVALFIEWLTDTGLTYTVREDYGDGEWGEPYYVETGDTEAEAVKVFGPGGLLEMGSPTPWLPGDED